MRTLSGNRRAEETRTEADIDYYPSGKKAPASTGSTLVATEPKEEEEGGELQVVFENGILVKDFTLAEIRKRLLDGVT